jgi:small subunit ribosomal protein S17
MTMAEERTVNRKSRVGTVVSDKNDKTIVVAIERAARHRLYRKVIRRTERYHVHDEDNAATLGDLVRIEECRPISRLKRWRLVEVLTEREVAEVAPEALDEELVDEVQRSAARAQAEAEAGEPVEGEEAAEASTDEAPSDEGAGQ